MVNKVIVMGHLTADPDVKASPTGVVTKIRLATNRYAGKEEDGTAKEVTEFHDLVCFGRTAEVAGDYLKKGRLVYVEGNLRTNRWETKDGQKRTSTEIVVDTLKMVGPKPAGEAKPLSAA